MPDKPAIAERYIREDQVAFWARAKESRGVRHAWKKAAGQLVTVCGSAPGIMASVSRRDDKPRYQACQHCEGWIITPLKVTNRGQANLPLVAASV